MKPLDARDYGTALLRISLGTIYLAHSALLKLVVFGMAGTVGYFESIGLPGFVAYATVAVEIAAGLMLLIGYRTRLAALAVLPVAIGATWAHAGNGWVFSGTGGGWEFPAFLVVLSIVQFLLGDGAFAWSNRPARRIGYGSSPATA